MKLTPEQLKTHLVTYYVDTWRSSGVSVTFQEMINQTWSSRRAPDEDGEAISTGESQPPEVFIYMKYSNCYLRVRCDNTPPRDTGLRAHYGDLEAFMLSHHTVVVAMNPLLDEDIEQQNLDGEFGRELLSNMSMKEKVI